MNPTIVSALADHGFYGHWVFDLAEGTEWLEFRRTWYDDEISDVLVIHSPGDVDGYRARDRVNLARPFDSSPCKRLAETRGGVNEVITTVLGWPAP